jgi:hypothetical protein
MFGDHDSIRSWSVIGLMIAFGALTALPMALLMFVALAFFLAPVAIVGLPFLLWAFFGGAQAELEAERRRSVPPHAVPQLRLAR